MSGHTLIKIEADCTATSTLDHSKAVQQTVSTVSSNSGTVYTDNSVTPLLTTHVFYQHPANLILSSTQSTEMTCKSQATSPVTCLTPPPEFIPLPEEEENSLSVQDASNQTESHILEDEELSKLETLSTEMLPTKTQIEVIRICTPVPEIIENNTNQQEITQCTEDEAEIKIENKPDISGLELLSNSIVEYESCRKLSTDIPIKYEEKERNEVKNEEEHSNDVLDRIAHMTIKDKETEASIYSQNMDENLGGLNLLCALAEQRFVEEVLEKQNEVDYKHYKQYKKPKVIQQIKKDNKVINQPVFEKDIKIERSKFCALKESGDSVVRNNPVVEAIKDIELDLEKEKLSVLQRVTGERGVDKCKKDLSYDFGAMDNDKTERNKKETDEVIKNCGCEDTRSRNYKDKDLSNEEMLKINDGSREWSPNFISAVERNMREKLADLDRQYKEKQLELSKLTLPTQECGDCNKRAKMSVEAIERTPSPIADKIEMPSTNYKSTPDILKPSTLCVVSSDDSKVDKPPLKTNLPCETLLKRKSGSESTSSTPEKFSSSKKRKVGRPKKLLSTPGLRIATETIVAKKPKTKNGLVGFFLAAKNRLQMQTKNGLAVSESPPRYVEEKPKHKVKTQHKKKSLLPSSTPEFKRKKKHKSKIRPKLKAEPKVKKVVQEEEECSEWEITMPVEEDNHVSKKIFFVDI